MSTSPHSGDGIASLNILGMDPDSPGYFKRNIMVTVYGYKYIYIYVHKYIHVRIYIYVAIPFFFDKHIFVPWSKLD